MSERMLIQAANKNGEVSIEWLGPLERRYKWDEYDEVRTLIPRETRWLGELGAYDPATQYFCIFCPIRIVASDSLLDFKSMEEVDAFLYQSSAVVDWVYNDEGWVVGFSKSPQRNQVSVEVFKITINGKPPQKIEGSRNGAIKIIKVPNNA